MKEKNVNNISRILLLILNLLWLLSITKKKKNTFQMPYIPENSMYHVPIILLHIIVLLMLGLIVLNFGTFMSKLSMTPNSIVDLTTTKPTLTSRSYVVHQSCFNKSQIAMIQKKQWILSLKELSLEHLLPENDLGIMDFYDELFGTLQLRIDNKRNPWTQHAHFNLITYYRIFKCGNDNVRSLLYEAAYLMSNQSFVFEQLRCSAEQCAHEHIHRVSPSEQREFFNSKKKKQNNFAFTFVRNPISRFISAINEIECRALNFPERQALLPVKGAIGSPERLQQWIKFILLGIAGSQQRLWQFQDIELAHLAPMVGSIVHGNVVEVKGLKLFRVEDFLQSWSDISLLTGIPAFESIAHRKELTHGWSQHECSSDNMHIVKNYSALIGFRRRQTAVGVEPVDPLQQAMIPYIRALCRIYLTDYVCAGYQLPRECEDIAMTIN